MGNRVFIREKSEKGGGSGLVKSRKGLQKETRAPTSPFLLRNTSALGKKGKIKDSIEKSEPSRKWAVERTEMGRGEEAVRIPGTLEGTARERRLFIVVKE